MSSFVARHPHLSHPHHLQPSSVSSSVASGPYPAHLAWASRAPSANYYCSPFGPPAAHHHHSAMDASGGLGPSAAHRPITSMPSSLVSPASPCPSSLSSSDHHLLASSYYSPANFYHSSRLALYGPQAYPSSLSSSPLFPYLSIPSPFSPYLTGSTAEQTLAGYSRPLSALSDARSGFWFPPALDRE